VTGADLKKRIVRIMTGRASRRLDFRRKLLLGVAGLLALAVPIVFEPLNVTAGRAESEAESLASGAYALDGVATRADTRMDAPAAAAAPAAKTATAKGKTCSKSVRQPQPVSSSRADLRRER
jgi:hypothetical protein